MVKICVLSDTHFPDLESGRKAIDALVEGPFSGVDLVLHAGDLGPPDLLLSFAPLPILAVAGNTDIRHPDLPEQRVLTLDGVRVALIHGWGASRGLEGRVIEHFMAREPDLIVFGHSHIPVYTRYKGLVLFNPGSLSRPRSGSGPTVGMLTLNQGHIEGEILKMS